MNTRIQSRSFCFFCGDHVAVNGATLADHGYRVPGYGHRTNGCIGSGMTPNELTTSQIEKSIRWNTEYIANAPALIARLIENSTNSRKLNTEVANVERGVIAAKTNIQFATEALAKWTPGTLLEVDVVQEATDKETAVATTRRASLEARIEKHMTKYARLEKELARELKNLSTWVQPEKMEQMVAYTHEKNTEEVARAQREEATLRAKLAIMR